MSVPLYCGSDHDFYCGVPQRVRGVRGQGKQVKGLYSGRMVLIGEIHKLFINKPITYLYLIIFTNILETLSNQTDIFKSNMYLPYKEGIISI